MKFSIILSTSLAFGTTAAPSANPATPKPKSVRILGNVTNPMQNRDSCCATNFGNRAFWTCRDTMYKMSNGQWSFPFSNSVGWSEFNADGSPKLQHGGEVGPGSTGKNDIWLMKGPNPTLPDFFKTGPDMCPDSGACDDGSRWVGWPDTPPLITHTAADGTITAYSWLTKTHLKGLTVQNQEQPTSLYKMTYKPTADTNVVPNVTVVSYEFWKQHEIGYGTYGNIVSNGYVYAYGKAETNGSWIIGLARVPVGSVEQKSKYEYFVNGKWTRTIPKYTDSAANVLNAGYGGQGTFYYSKKHASFFWIGQAGVSIAADFYMTSASSPEGPWGKPYLIYQGPNKSSFSYSLQAHPYLLRPSDNGIYVTWTQTADVYITPLAYIAFE
ncbi:hypothetical protein VHEMI03246 [[Torrubiella] hemipterigena]|uniref:DUF4185 domain-containing protein n=1 Tax=[Torrubiella] hemipterigena TaxID=1531966 RepID=A0A0A1SY07_9HYPO|nr:hypothetical protein VHEMI03246 [[Torrubiella] hemipterigena]